MPGADGPATSRSAGGAMNSLERSLQAGLVVGLIVLMLAFLWVGSLTARLLGESFVHARLGDEAEALVAALDHPPLAFATLARPRLSDGARLDPDYDRPLSGRYYVIRLEPDGEILSRSAWEQRLSVPRLAPGQQLKRRADGVNGEPLLFWLGGFSREGQAFTVVVAEDIAPIEARLDVFRWYFATITLVLLVALVAVQHLIVRRSVEKLDAIRGELERIEHGRAASLSEDVPREVRPLVREFNRLLGRFEQRTRQSRNAVGNLAHSLKGPLNLLLQAAGPETTDGAGELDPVDRRAIAQNAERIRQLIESELRRARLAGRGAAGRLFDLEAELPPLAGLLGQVYSDKAVDVRWRIGAGVELMHDRQDMLELIGNLLDNAVKWSDGLVMLTLRVVGDGVLLDVEDDGPGCSVEELERLTTRGVRLDESVAGHGLGLSIVKDIVDTYDGALELGRSARLGGFRASVSLPRAA